MSVEMNEVFIIYQKKKKIGKKNYSSLLICCDSKALLSLDGARDLFVTAVSENFLTLEPFGDLTWASHCYEFRLYLYLLPDMVKFLASEWVREG